MSRSEFGDSCYCLDIKGVNFQHGGVQPLLLLNQWL